VTSGDYAPGDVLIWSGRHVAVYIGNGQAVHGGYGGNQTVVASAFIDGAPDGVVRFG
jgi:cell wall-associated NlpC family hydrolase